MKKTCPNYNTLLSTVILRITKKMLVSPKVSKAFYVMEHWLDLWISQSVYGQFVAWSLRSKSSRSKLR